MKQILGTVKNKKVKMVDDHGLSQAKAQLESIQEMVKQLKWSQDDTHEGWNTESEDEARDVILNDPLSCLVREDWHEVGADDIVLEEYELLLCTGGPAVRVTGKLGSGFEPVSASIQYQDWGTPWTEYRLTSDEEETVLTYARCFYYGE